MQSSQVKAVSSDLAATRLERGLPHDAPQPGGGHKAKGGADGGTQQREAAEKHDDLSGNWSGSRRVCWYTKSHKLI